jgi:hypothetical protein
MLHFLTLAAPFWLIGALALGLLLGRATRWR